MKYQISNIKYQSYSSNLKTILKFIIFGLLIVIFNFSFLIFHLDKAAAAGLSLGVYPPIIQITATPPTNITAPITISNLSEQTITLDIKFKPFTASDAENGEVSYLSENQSLSADPLIFQRVRIQDGINTVNSITLAPYQQKKLNLHILLPEDEPLSDYYFSVIFSSQAKGDAAPFGLSEAEVPSATPNTALQNQSQNVAGIATNVLLSIGPKGKTEGTLAEFSTPLFIEKGPVPFTVRVKNTGDHFITPQGVILIKNMFGQTVGKVDLLQVNILRGTIRAIPDALQSPDATPSATSESLIANSRSSPKAFWPESFILGPYKATLTIALSPQGPLFRKSIYFVGFPVQSAIGLLAIIAILSLIRNRLKKHT